MPHFYIKNQYVCSFRFYNVLQEILITKGVKTENRVQSVVYYTTSLFIITYRFANSRKNQNCEIIGIRKSAYIANAVAFFLI